MTGPTACAPSDPRWREEASSSQPGSTVAPERADLVPQCTPEPLTVSEATTGCRVGRVHVEFAAHAFDEVAVLWHLDDEHAATTWLPEDLAVALAEQLTAAKAPDDIQPQDMAERNETTTRYGYTAGEHAAAVTHLLAAWTDLADDPAYVSQLAHGALDAAARWRAR
jgi:hypothetical protein